MDLRGITKAALAFCLMGGMLLTCACMLFVCPLLGAASVTEESCHPVPDHDPAPVQCPYAVTQLVYAPPLLDLTFGQDPNRPDAAVTAMPEAPEPADSRPGPGPVRAKAPPGLALHAFLCVFRI